MVVARQSTPDRHDGIPVDLIHQGDLEGADRRRELAIPVAGRQRELTGRKQMLRDRFERAAAQRGAPGFLGPIEGIGKRRKGHVGSQATWTLEERASMRPKSSASPSRSSGGATASSAACLPT